MTQNKLAETQLAKIDAVAGLGISASVLFDKGVE